MPAMELSEAHSEQPQKASQFALFEIGFRPFFLGAGIFAVATMILWAGIYLLGISLPFQSMSPFQWHAHEMIYGFGMAVVAGFLLTAVKNWTGITTLSGSGLASLFCFWLAARLGFAIAGSYFWLAACFDALFSLVLIIAVCRPIIISRQWKQMAIVSKLFILACLNGLFYAGLFGWIGQGLFWGIYGGLYILLGLILTMGRRVIPSFIEQGVDYPVSLPNSKWLDIGGMIVFVGFFISELFFQSKALSACLALVLFVAHAIRLIGWHTPGIWRKSLLWSIYLSFWFICLGFLLFAASYWYAISEYLAIHAFAYGGVGLITIGMMSRISLGHTGRRVSHPPAAIGYAFGLLFCGAVVRVLVPLFDMMHYPFWIGLSQLLWVLAFALFVVTYAHILIKPRIES